MTTLQLATRIVEAIRVRPHLSHAAAAVVVLDVLRTHDAWFCRVSEPEDGCTVDTAYELFQPSLFDSES